MKPSFRKKYFIDKRLQTKFILFTIVLLLVYTLLFVVILFVPYVVPLSFDYPLDEQTEAARMVLSLHTSIWPALAIVMLILGVSSIFVSHKVAGPIYRLKRSLAEVAGGNINLTLKFRKRDELHDLADSVNLVIHELRSLVGSVKNDHEIVSRSIAEIEELIEKRQIEDAVGRKLLEKLITNRNETAQTLDKYADV
jgi:methyl-accepting chemotaxis protein